MTKLPAEFRNEDDITTDEDNDADMADDEGRYSTAYVPNPWVYDVPPNLLLVKNVPREQIIFRYEKSLQVTLALADESFQLPLIRATIDPNAAKGKHAFIYDQLRKAFGYSPKVAPLQLPEFGSWVRPSNDCYCAQVTAYKKKGCRCIKHADLTPQWCPFLASICTIGVPCMRTIYVIKETKESKAFLLSTLTSRHHYNSFRGSWDRYEYERLHILFPSTMRHIKEESKSILPDQVKPTATTRRHTKSMPIVHPSLPLPPKKIPNWIRIPV